MGYGAVRILHGNPYAQYVRMSNTLLELTYRLYLMHIINISQVLMLICLYEKLQH